ncbi:HAMP domain-containing sensor histidine kinase [Variovorax sp. J22R24]|uniref:sensor histidine kinase n=1 Tax=Variovorax gracilis TaxID=3053502 RepID=UPI0025778C94|nr:HAMP domain-containing sensor histidine kinase [Variovorax sp. J22R24]MDM0108864.1 HAMP domain-containing sensor histidine kinase [Variovorax sp. J22R24]
MRQGLEADALSKGAIRTVPTDRDADSARTDPGAGIPPGVIVPARLQAIHQALFDSFLEDTVFRQLVSGGLMLLLAVFCWSYEASGFLMVWLLIGLGTVSHRSRCERAYRNEALPLDAPRRRTDFVRRMVPVYTVQGAVWGASLLFFFDRIEPYSQFACWLILACVASAPLTSVALVPRLLRAYTNSLFLVLLGCLITTVALRSGALRDVNVLFLALPVFHWWLLARYGRFIFRRQAAQFGERYDLTVREKEAQAAIGMKNRFLAAAAHDLRQPVSALSLYAEFLLESPELHLELAPKIASATLAVKNLFESLFDLASLDSGQILLDVEEVPLRAVLEGLRVQFEPLAAASKVELRVRHSDATLVTDVVRLRRMAGNILSNAIKYSPAGTKVLLAARVHARQVRIEVWDQGHGIGHDDLGKIFEEFYRVDRPELPSVEGVGLGLSIVSRLSHVLKTRISVDSRVGRGTRFRLELNDLDQADARHAASRDVG